MEAKDIPKVTELLTQYLKQFQIKRVFTEEEVKNTLILSFDQGGKIVHPYVIEDENS